MGAYIFIVVNVIILKPLPIKVSLTFGIGSISKKGKFTTLP